MAEIWAKDKDVMFRTQLVKSKLGVDVSPSWETALQLHQHLRAESENLLNGLPTTTRSGTTEPTYERSEAQTLAAKWLSTSKATSNDH